MTNLKLFSLFFLPLFLLLGCLMGLNVQAQTNAEAIQIETLKLRESTILSSKTLTPVIIENGKQIVKPDIIYYQYIADEVTNPENVIFDKGNNYSDKIKLNDTTIRVYANDVFYLDTDGKVKNLVDDVVDKTIWTNSKISSPTDKILSLLKTPYVNADTLYAPANDGEILRNNPSGESWSTIRTNTGTATYENLANSSIFYIVCKDASNYKYLGRSSVRFNTNVGSEYQVDSAVLNIHGQGKVDDIAITPNINVYSFSPAGNGLTTADYLNCGTTAFANTITYAGWSTTGYNQFTFNTTGKNAINLTGTSSFCLLNANYDAANTSPNTCPAEDSASYLSAYWSEQTGTSQDPYLDLTISLASTSTPPIEASSTSPVYTVCVPQTNNDLSLITGCAITATYSSTTGTTTVETQYVYHIPFFVWIILAICTLFIASRIIIELIIRWRA